MNAHKKYDLVIVGNGVLGVYAVMIVSENHPDVSIALVGDVRRPGSASIAAGAMLNVFGEIDYDRCPDNYQDDKLYIGRRAINSWISFLKSHGVADAIITADHTIVFLNKDSTYLERKCFETIKDKYYSLIGLRVPNEDELSPLAELNRAAHADFVVLEQEYGLSVPKLFAWMDSAIDESNNIDVINSQAESVSALGNTFSIATTNSGTVIGDKIVVCTGASVNSLMDELSKEVLPVYYGVGTSLEVEFDDKIVAQLPKRCVIRSPNRGSTCGVHLVPRGKSSYYLGAGSYISTKPIFAHRMGTVKYLIDCLESDFIGIGSAHKINMNPVLGFRPMSLDGRPMIGSLKEHPNCFVATGTKRDGLTIAPCISEEILSWFSDEVCEPIFEKWHPERAPISYGDHDFATESYIENKIAGLIEHGLVSSSKEELRIRAELEHESEKFHLSIRKRFDLPSDFGVHPEILNIFGE